MTVMMITNRSHADVLAALLHAWPSGEFVVRDEEAGVQLEVLSPSVAESDLVAAFTAWDAAALDRRKAEAERTVDLRAGEARAAFASAGAFLDEEYRQAASQAERLLAGDPGPFPALAADVVAGTFDPRLGRGVQTEAEAADLVLYTRGSIWLDALNAIRAIRLKAKAEVRAAETEADVAAVLVGLNYPEPPA